MKFVFLSSVQVGYDTLKPLLEEGFRPAAVLSLKEKYAANTSGYVDFSGLCAKYQVPHRKIRNINSKASLRYLKEIQTDLLIVCGWQRLLKEEALVTPRLGCIGFHASLLPKYRGRAPVNWAIIHGERETGVSCFYLDLEADAGDLLAQYSFPILYEDTVKTVYEKVSQGCFEILKDLLSRFETGPVQGQDNPARQAPLYKGRKPEDGEINLCWSTRKIYDFVRALTRPYPGAFLKDNSQKMIVWSCLEGSFPDQGKVYQAVDGAVTFTDYEIKDQPSEAK